MNATELVTNLSDIRNPHYFNGRVLTADAMREEQEADRRQRRLLGTALGEGIATGLEVTLLKTPAAEPPQVSVTEGLAVNQNGETVWLKGDTTVNLAQAPPTGAPAAGLFAECTAAAVPTGSATQSGLYLLTVRPTSEFRERAPQVGFQNNGGTGCGSKYTYEGVKFMLVPVNLAELKLHPAAQKASEQAQTLAPLGSPPPADKSQFHRALSMKRNLLAYLCFGIFEQREFANSPFVLQDEQSPFVSYGLLDALRAKDQLSACDVPLALLYWTADGIQFLDMWAVRRRLIPPTAGGLWPLLTSVRRVAEAEAIWLQFAEQLRQIAELSGNPQNIEAKDWFALLPAAGYLPTGTGGFQLNTFFKGLKKETAVLDVAFARLLMEQSWFIEPLYLDEKLRPTPNDAPMLLIYKNSTPNPGYALFIRAQKGAAQAPVVEDEPAAPTVPTTPDTRPGHITVKVSFKKSGQTGGKPGFFPYDSSSEESAAVTSRKAYTVQTTDSSTLSVRARNSVGTIYTATPVKSVYYEFTNQHYTLYELPGLPADDYQVECKAKGYIPAAVPVALAAGATEAVTVTLVPVTKGGGGGLVPEPRPRIKAPWKDRPYRHVIVIKEKIIYPPPDDDWVRPKYDPLDDPLPDEVRYDLEPWAEYFQQQVPTVPIDVGDLRVVVNPRYIPGERAAAPYAYALFGENGLAVPLLLPANDHTFDLAVPVNKGGLAGFDQATEARLAAYGLTDLDALGAAWTGLVAEALGVSAPAADSLIAEARTQTGKLLKETPLRIFNGVDSALETALKSSAIKINTATDLANADARTLATQLAAQNIPNVNEGFAQRLIDQARATVFRSSWALDDSQLGLNASQLAGLQAVGIVSKGQFKTRATETTGKALLGSVLKTDDKGIDEFTGRINQSLTRATAMLEQNRTLETPITSANEVLATPTTGGAGAAPILSSDESRLLAQSGFGTVGSLVNVNPTELANLLGGDQARATALLNTVRIKAGLNR